MKRSTKMLLMKGSGREDGRERNRRSGSEYEDGRMNNILGGGIHYHFYDTLTTEDKFRNSNGREHYDNGRYAPMRGESGGWIESRFRDRRGREHYDSGRYAPMKSEYGDYSSSEDSYMPYPYYESDGGKVMRPIGFRYDDQREMHHNGYVGDEPYMGRERSRELGHARYDDYNGPIRLDEQEAKVIVSEMENPDGKRGGHWTLEQTEQIRKQYGLNNIDPCEFYVVINSMYADYSNVAKELGVNNMEFYAKMAKAFISDPDAKPGKVARYFETIPK